MEQRVIVRGLLETADGILLLRRPDHKKYNPGLYELPGGKVDMGEAPPDALRREFREETNIEVVIGSIVHVGSYVMHEMHAIELVYNVHANDVSSFRLSDEHIDSQWARQPYDLPMSLGTEETLQSR